MRKFFVLCISLLLLFSALEAVNITNFSSLTDSFISAKMRQKKKKAKMRVKKKKAKKAKMRQKKTKLTWKFQKGKVNPTISFYDMDAGKRQLRGKTKIKGGESITLTCKKGHKICFGGDFKLVNNKYTAGCGNNCRAFNKLTSSQRREACEICSTKTVNRRINVRKKGPHKVNMTWNFSKGKVNPTVSFYDMKQNRKVLKRNIKINGNQRINLQCFEGNKICYGGDFKLVGNKYVAGCGKNCKDLNKLKSYQRRDSCAVCKPKTINRTPVVRKLEPPTVQMSWNFSPGKVNPTVSFYDISDRNKKVGGSIKLKGSVSKTISCKKGHKICFGGNFKLVNKHYVAGCGNNCSYLNRMSMSEKSQSCSKCRAGSVNKKSKVRKQ